MILLLMKFNLQTHSLEQLALHTVVWPLQVQTLIGVRRQLMLIILTQNWITKWTNLVVHLLAMLMESIFVVHGCSPHRLAIWGMRQAELLCWMILGGYTIARQQKFLMILAEHLNYMLILQLRRKSIVHIKAVK